MLLTATEIIQQSWQVYTRQWRRLAIYIFFLFLPSLAWFVFSRYLANFLSSGRLVIIALAAVLILSILFSFWTSLATALEIKSLWRQEPMERWQDYFTQSSLRLGPALGAIILGTLIIIGGIILFIIPGIIFAVWYAFAGYAALFNGQSGLAALRASKSLTAGRWWAMIWRLAAPSTLFVMASSVVQFIIMIPVSYAIPPASTELAAGILGVFFSALLAPLTILPLVILYFNAKDNPLDAPATVSAA